MKPYPFPKTSVPLRLSASVIKGAGGGMGSLNTEAQRLRDMEPEKYSEPLSLRASVLKHDTGYGERSVP